jgi:hypothetical protein
LTVSSGKLAIIQSLANGKHGRRLMVGDGASDLATKPVVDLFVGFGGIVAREKVKNEADVFVHLNSLAPILPLAAGPSGYAKIIGTSHQAIFDKGLLLAQSGMSIKDETSNNAFQKAFVKS